VEAIDYAAQEGAAVANMSLGGADEDTVLDEAITAAGILVIAAAGNGTTGKRFGASPDRCYLDGGDPVSLCPSYPAASPSPNIVSVAAMTNRGALAYFSEYGSRGPDGTTATGVDIGAPGQDILSTVPTGPGVDAYYGYAFFSGTSMAAPHVAGVAALLLSAEPSLTPAQLKKRLIDRGRVMTALGSGKSVSGRMVSASGAVGVTRLSQAFSSPSGTFGYGITIRGTLSAGSPQAGRSITLQRATSSGWTDVCTAPTDVSGVASCYTKPTANSTYRWTFSGAAGLDPVTSTPTLLTVKAKVGISVSDTTPRRGQTVTFAAYVSPNHAGRLVVLQRLSGSTWVNVRTATLPGSKATFSVTLGSAGTSQWRTRFSGDADHAANSSSTLTLRTS
jgi:hypothetical protein